MGRALQPVSCAADPSSFAIADRLVWNGRSAREGGGTKFLSVFGFLIVATTLEAFGDATVRIGLYNRSGAAQIAVLLGGAALLFGYGLMLNLAPLPFERVVGLYLATLFCVWQAVSFVAFRATPSIPILVGGTLIVAGGLIVTFWRHGAG